MGRKKANEDSFGELVKKLGEITPLIKELPPEVRSQAFDLFKPLLRSGLGTADNFSQDTDLDDSDKGNDDQETDSDDGMEKFFGKFSHTKPKDNVTLIAGWFYSQHGLLAITTNQINKVAGEVGITVPSRPDMTLRQKTVSGKSCFQYKGKGYVPTVHGETFLKDTYKIKKGNKPVSKSSKSDEQ